MAKRIFIMAYEFTSTKADGDSFVRTVEIKASTRLGAMALAKGVGFREFGGLFNDNCFDWHIKGEKIPLDKAKLK